MPVYEDVDWNFRLRLIDWLGEREAMLSCGNKALGIPRQFMERARRKKLHFSYPVMLRRISTGR